MRSRGSRQSCFCPVAHWPELSFQLSVCLVLGLGLLTGVGLTGCQLRPQALVVALGEPAWMDPIDHWSTQTGREVRFELLRPDGSWDHLQPWPDLVIGPALATQWDRLEELTWPTERSKEAGLEPVQGLIPPERLRVVPLTYVPAVILSGQRLEKNPVEVSQLLSLTRQERFPLRWGTAVLLELFPCLRGAVEEDDLGSTLSGLVRQLSGQFPLIELADGRLPAWILPEWRFLELGDLGSLGWAYLAHDERILTLAGGSAAGIPRGGRGEELLWWLVLESDLKSWIQNSSSLELQRHRPVWVTTEDRESTPLGKSLRGECLMER